MGLSNRYAFFEESEERLVLKKGSVLLPPKVEVLEGWKKSHKKMNELVENYNEQIDLLTENIEEWTDNALRNYYEESGEGIAKIMCKVPKSVAILQEQKIVARQAIDELKTLVDETKRLTNKRKLQNQLRVYKKNIDRLKLNKKNAKEYSKKKVGVITPQMLGNTILRILTCLYDSYDYLSDEIRISQGERKSSRFSVHHNLKRNRKMKKLKGVDNKKQLAYNIKELEECGKKETVDYDNLSAMISRAINNEQNILETKEKEKDAIKKIIDALTGIAKIIENRSISAQQAIKIVTKNIIGLQNSFKNINKRVDDEAKEGAPQELLENIKYSLRLDIYVELYRTGAMIKIINAEIIFEEKLSEDTDINMRICAAGTTVSYGLVVLFLTMGPAGVVPAFIFGGIECFFGIAGNIIALKAERDMKKVNEVMYGETLKAPQNEIQYPKKSFGNKKKEDSQKAKKARIILSQKERSQYTEEDEEPEKKPFKHKIKMFSEKEEQTDH